VGLCHRSSRKGWKGLSRDLLFRALVAAAALAALPRSAIAQEEDAVAYETVVHGQPALATDETTALAETIDVSDETRRFLTVGDALDTAVGVDVRTLGGVGAYGATSIRGSTSSQVPVYLDGVLLNAGGFATVDLGALGLDVVDRIEIYRGSAPPSLPAAGIGGAVVLETKAFERPFTEVTASFGSFGTARLTALRADRLGDVRALALVSASGSLGDFDYLNRNGTIYDTADDAVVPRLNNAHTAYEAFVKLDGAAGGVEWTVADDFGVKQQGVPGTESVSAEHARLRTTRNALSLGAEARPRRRVIVRADASYLALTDAFDDPLGEVGVGAGSNGSRSDAIAGGLALEWGVGAQHRLSGRLDGRFERFAQRDLGAEDLPSPARRVTAGAVLADEWSPLPAVRIVPSIRVEQRHSAFGGGALPGHADELEAATSDALYAQPSLGVLVDWGHGLSSRLNAGRYVRAPDLGELFGDRGAAVGNPDLEAETAWNADAGLAWQLENRGALDVLRLEGSGFASDVRDLIAYVQNSQDTVRPENVALAEILGAEAAGRVSFAKTVTLSANYTYLHAVNRTPAPYLYGKMLPGRPAHALYAEAELERVFGALAWHAATDLEYSGVTYLDQANLRDAGLGAALLGIEVGVEHVRARVSLTLEIDNLLDTTTVVGSDGRTRPLSDFDGFPLPGRSFMATLRWRD
jgi:vitamin B12 transporter